MTTLLHSKTKSSLTAQMFLIISGSVLIYLTLFIVVAVAVVMLFVNIESGESLIPAFAHSFFKDKYNFHPM